jgi:hypothetical protein
MQLSERWGSLLHFTKFLSEKHQKVFLDQFCASIQYQQKHAQRTANRNIQQGG